MATPANLAPLLKHIRTAHRLIRLAPVLDACRKGKRRRSLRQVAAILNQAGVPAPRGGQWASEQVRRALLQAERDTAALKEWQHC